MKQTLWAVAKFLFLLSIGLVILYFVYRNQEAAYQAECQCKGDCVFPSLGAKIIDDFRHVNVFWLVVICLLFILSNISRAVRWQMLLHPMGYRPRLFNAFFTTMIGYLVNLAISRAGEFTKAAALTRYEKISIDKVFGTVVVDRIFDVIMLLLITGLAFLLQFQHLWNFLFGDGAANLAPACVNPITTTAAPANSGFNWLLWGGIAAVLLAGGIWWWLRRRRQQQTASAEQVSLMQRFRTLWFNFSEGIKTVFRLKHPWWFVFHTIFIWVMYYLMTYLCFFAFAPTSHLSPLAGLLVFTFGSFGMVIPSPGGMGTYQLAVMAALVIYGVQGNDAFAFANILFFTITIFCNILFGFLAYLVLPIYNKNYVPLQPQQA